MYMLEPVGERVEVELICIVLLVGVEVSHVFALLSWGFVGSDSIGYIESLMLYVEDEDTIPKVKKLCTQGNNSQLSNAAELRFLPAHNRITAAPLLAPCERVASTTVQLYQLPTSTKTWLQMMRMLSARRYIHHVQVIRAERRLIPNSVSNPPSGTQSANSSTKNVSTTI
jgi:hypothetical protein